MRKAIIPILTLSLILLVALFSATTFTVAMGESSVVYDGFLRDGSAIYSQASNGYYYFTQGNFIFGKEDGDSIVYEGDYVYLKGTAMANSEGNVQFSKSSSGDQYLKLSIMVDGVSVFGTDGKINLDFKNPLGGDYKEIWFAINDNDPQGYFEGKIPTSSHLGIKTLTVTATLTDSVGGADLSAVELVLPLGKEFCAFTNVLLDQGYYYDAPTLKDTSKAYGDRFIGDHAIPNPSGELTFPATVKGGMEVSYDTKGAYTLVIKNKDASNPLFDADGYIPAFPKEYNIRDYIQTFIEVNGNRIEISSSPNTSDTYTIVPREIKVAISTEGEGVSSEDGYLLKTYGETYSTINYTPLEGYTYYKTDALQTLDFTCEGSNLFAKVGEYSISVSEGTLVKDGDVDKSDYYVINIDDNIKGLKIVPRKVSAQGLNAIYSKIDRSFPYDQTGYDAMFEARREEIEGVNGETISVLYGFTEESKEYSFGNPPTYTDFNKEGGLEIDRHYTAFVKSFTVKQSDGTPIEGGEANYDLQKPIFDELKPHSFITVVNKQIYIAFSLETTPEEYKDYAVFTQENALQLQYGVFESTEGVVSLAIKVDESENPLLVQFKLEDGYAVDGSGRLTVGESYRLLLADNQTDENYGKYTVVGVDDDFKVTIIPKRLVFSNYYTQFTQEYGETSTSWTVKLDNGFGGKEEFVVYVKESVEGKRTGETLPLYWDDSNYDGLYHLVGVNEYGEMLSDNLLDVPFTVAPRKITVAPAYGSNVLDKIVDTYKFVYGQEDITEIFTYKDSSDGKTKPLSEAPFYIQNSLSVNVSWGEGDTSGYPIKDNKGKYNRQGLTFVIKYTLVGDDYCHESTGEKVATIKALIVARPLDITFTFNEGCGTKTFFDTMVLSDQGEIEISNLVAGESITVTPKSDGCEKDSKVGKYKITFTLSGTGSDNYTVGSSKILDHKGKTTEFEVVERKTEEMYDLNFTIDKNGCDETTILLNGSGIGAPFVIEYGYKVDGDKDYVWTTKPKITGLVSGTRYFLTARYKEVNKQNEVGKERTPVSYTTPLSAPSATIDDMATGTDTLTVRVAEIPTTKRTTFTYTVTAKQSTGESNDYTAVRESAGVYVFSDLPSGNSYNILVKCTTNFDDEGNYTELSSVWTIWEAPKMTERESYTLGSKTFTIINPPENVLYEYRITLADYGEEDLLECDWETYSEPLVLETETDYIMEIRVKAMTGGSYHTGGLAGESTIFHFSTYSVHAVGDYEGGMLFFAKYLLVGIFGLSIFLLIIAIAVFAAVMPKKTTKRK